MSFADNLVASMATLGTTAIAGDPTRGEHAGIDALRLPSGAVIGWRCPDDAGERESQIGASLVRVAAEAAQRMQAIDADDSRTESWKAEQRAKIAEDTAQRFAVARADADKIAAEFGEADARESAPAPLGAGDHVASLVDHECRAWLRTLDRDALVELGKELTDPKHARLLEAMMRSPIPLPSWIEPIARSAWIEHRMRADPKGVHLRRQAADRVEWLGTIVGQVEGVITAMQPPNTQPIVTRAG